MNVKLSSPSWVPCHLDTLLLGWKGQGVGLELGLGVGPASICLVPHKHG